MRTTLKEYRNVNHQTLQENIIMKLRTFLVSLSTVFLASNALALEASFSDIAWDGIDVPEGQQCQKFGGDNPATPKLMIKDIPTGTNAIILEYSDRDSEKMNNGGHGRMVYTLHEPASEVEIPSVPGHTFDIPADFKSIEAHRSPGWDKEGAYMPPCSGGKGHAYYVTIKAADGEKVLAETVLEMGSF
jgi:hypothetical protein